MVGCTAEIPSKHDRSGSKGEMTALKSDFRYTPEADMDDPMSKNGSVANSVPTEATVCFSRLEPTLHGSPALCLAAGVVVLPLHTRRRHRQHVMTCLQRYP